MPPRFFVPDLSTAAQVVRLPTDEAHHLVKVLRMQPGDLVHLFDGRGLEWRGRVDSADRSGSVVALLEPVASRTPSVDLTLVQAVLKGAAMDAVIRDCTMVGVAAILPILTERTTVKASVMDSAPERWRRIALAAAKQCGAARLPVISSVVAFDGWLRGQPFEHAYVLLEPDAMVERTMRLRQLAGTPPPPRTLLLIGPEGGWTPAERDRALAAGCAPLTLGRMTLRADAVPLAAAAALLAIWDV